MTDPPCATCYPIVDGDQRRSEGHVGVRFGDRPFLCLLDGVDVSNRSNEAIAGADGWVRLWDHDDKGEVILCCYPGPDAHVRTHIEWGNVQVIKNLSTRETSPGRETGGRSTPQAR